MSAMNGVFPTLQDSDALLCYTCELSLNNINKLEKKIDDLKTRVRNQLSALCKVAQKRPSVGADSNPPLAKQLKTQPLSYVESVKLREVELLVAVYKIWSKIDNDEQNLAHAMVKLHALFSE